MSRLHLSIALGLLGVAALCAPIGLGATLGACNSGTGDCPDKSQVAPGGACSDDNLQCAYDLSTPTAACDGTTTTIATSCTCKNGSWDCPAAFACDAGEGDATTDDGGEDANVEEDAGADASEEPAADADQDAGLDAEDGG